MFCWNISTLFSNTLSGMFLPLQEYYTLRMFRDSVLRKIFGLKREEVTKDWRRMLNEELHNLYSSPNIVQMIR
jgi:hypothetical protein